MATRFNTQQNSGDWMSKLNQIKAAQEKYAKDQSIMSTYERQTTWGDIEAKISQNYSSVFNGVKNRFDAAVGSYKAAAAKRAAAIAREINSWDAAKLNAEMQAFQMRVSMELNKRDTQGIFSGAPVSKRIEDLYREALASGDRYKMRAAAEVLRGTDTEKLPSEQRTAVMMIARNASDKLDDLRNTDEIKAAISEESAAVKAMQDEQQFVREAGAVMRDAPSNILGREVSNFGKLASTVKFERADGRVNIRILDINDPEITGIAFNAATFEKLKNEQEGE